MGLDSVEIIMSVEESFGISISDAEASQVRTVGDLYQIVRSRIAGKAANECNTAKAFYRLRRAVMTTTGCRREDIRPQTLVEDVMPRKERRRQWRELESNLGFKLPLLAPTPLVFWGTTAILWLASVPSALRGKRDMWVLLIGLGGFLFLSFIAAAILTRPLWTKLPCATMGELAKTIVRDHFVRFSPGGATDGEVRETLLEIISHQLGVEKTQILAESRFVEDLNAD